MKKLFIKLMGWQEQSTGPDRFHQPEVIERELAEERRQQAMEHERERIKDQMEKREIPSEQEILNCYTLKTGSMLSFPAVTGGILGGASEDQLKKLDDLGCSLGRWYQLVDDIKDTIGDKDSSKSVGRDAGEGRKTIVTVYGIDRARELRDKAQEETMEILASIQTRQHDSGLERFLRRIHAQAQKI